jgi:low affinity Fe/Cu permease
MGDKIEQMCAHPSAFWIFSVLFIGGIFINVDVTNIFISYFTAALLLLTLGGQRQSNRATHAKLDDLECAINEADSTNVRLEERPEKEIEAKRHDTTAET